MTGPRLLKGIEKFFDGPIKTTPLGSPLSDPISWLDIVSFARAHPKEFTLCHLPDGSRCCQFTLKGLQVEINEDDWRLIWSGALERFPLDHPFDEDEKAESATLEILEQRTSMLYKKADEVAARARILHHRIGQRQQDIRRRRRTQDGSSNTRPQPSTPDMIQRSGGFGAPYDLRADLLQQFTTASTPPSHSRSASVAAGLIRTGGQSSPGPSLGNHQQSGISHRGSMDNQSSSDNRTDPFRIYITHRIEKLDKGEAINPPCDRCRRLNTTCQKHLSACVGCTKKHAKCSWKSLTDEDMRDLKQEPRLMSIDEGRRIIRDDRPELPSLRDSLLKYHGRGDGEGTQEPVDSELTIYENGSPLPSREMPTEPLKSKSADSIDTGQGTVTSNSPRRSEMTRTPEHWRHTQIPSISTITSTLRQEQAMASTPPEPASR